MSTHTTKAARTGRAVESREPAASLRRAEVTTGEAPAWKECG
ncbi:MAG: hypothetical protein AVDCRST_MAG19-4104 [uncultured Thermomicrobiales bacterium]|uniref:Uncharacterized protein n=1 Tax=uncultured Thermomicrobiales bacterium TaxID=1645740 RepID=A0A6J4VK98_9BACT|nr:MAG: hypothetical protein AVDCRST_MAG19-4104 [uncultured Thermomicrobiales bacterium]